MAKILTQRVYRKTLTSIVIDQFEEVLTNSDPAEASRFLGLLRATFADPGTL